jgi:hypothetical protein
MSLRDRQRARYCDRLDQLFLRLRQKYEPTFGDRCPSPSPHIDRLTRLFRDLCEQCGLATRMRLYQHAGGTQMRLL